MVEAMTEALLVTKLIAKPRFIAKTLEQNQES